MTNDAKRVVNGTYGRVWIDGELWAEVEKFEAKVSVDYEDVTFAGSGANYRKATGWKGEGSMTIKKVYSRVQRKMAAAVRTGQYPRFQIVGKVEDPDAFGSERVVLNDVTIDDFALLSFELKKLGSEEIKFAFSDYEMIETIQS